MTFIYLWLQLQLIFFHHLFVFDALFIAVDWMLEIVDYFEHENV